MFSSVYNAVQQGEHIHKYKAYWYMNFSIINGCGTCENNIHGHSFEVALEFTKCYNYKRKSKQTNVRKKLQSLDIIAIKSRETRSVIYTCRYSGGQFIP